ncbi:MAG: 16S rRNA (uracil(1498)-N(3))-methyltransferase [Gammaproteobacteria bacterium]|nr:16S rRNA (uracil(1498)-N(3))-methyltransferase [Gammaproteobacteria bacterium]
MRLSRIHTPQSLITGSTVVLADDAAHYVGKVLRLRPGEIVALFNGNDGEHLAEVVSVDKKSVTVRLDSQVLNSADPVLPIHLGLGISRGERMDYAIQKATEAGVSSITPLLTERCEVKLKGERIDNRLSHWHRIAISACEQSGRCTVPFIESPLPLQEWLARERAGVSFVLDHRGTQGYPPSCQPEEVTLLIGPEGGLADEEVDKARANGFAAVRLGPRVLRTETAPVIAISLAQFLWGDYRS